MNSFARRITCGKECTGQRATQLHVMWENQRHRWALVTLDQALGKRTGQDANHMGVCGCAHSSMPRRSQNVGQPVSVDGWMERHSVVHPHGDHKRREICHLSQHG